MRYARTIDGRICEEGSSPRDYVQRTATSIRRLCDCFVVCKDDVKVIGGSICQKRIRTICRSLGKAWRNYCNFYGEKYLYGAVWTERGLKYVARMDCATGLWSLI